MDNDIPLEERRFEIRTLTDGHEVLGGAVEAGNVYVNVYAEYEGKRHTELNPNEHTYASFHLSGTHGRYIVVRVK
jgi:hypothetical protein